MWAATTPGLGIQTEKAGPFEFAFENYTALGYGDAVAGQGYRLIGPITALNGLLLIGWSVAIIFEVMRMAGCAGRPPQEARGLTTPGMARLIPVFGTAMAERIRSGR